MTLISKRKFLLIIGTMLLYCELGYGLECFVCHNRNDKECSDPFEGNKTDIIDCMRVRDVGQGVVAAASALGASPGQYSVLAQPPHICFKLSLGQYLVRGCGKPDMCQNYTTECDTCDSDGCNRSSIQKPLHAIIFISIILYRY